MKKLTIAALAFAGGVVVARGAGSAPALLGPSALSWEQIENGPVKGKGHAIFASPTATLDELEMHVTHLPPGQAPHPPHSHADEELVIIKEGTLEALQSAPPRFYLAFTGVADKTGTLSQDLVHLAEERLKRKLTARGRCSRR